MKIENKHDMKLVGRAIREGWNYDRAEVVAALMELVTNRDPDLMLDAIEKLQVGDALAIKAEEAEIKRELMELKKLGDENAIRLRLLELAQRAPVDELARLASDNGFIDRADARGQVSEPP